MTNHISVESLSVVRHANTAVITTELLAQLYGTTNHSITKNHRSNANRFVCGKHYFKIEGADLKDFKNKVTNSDFVASRAKHLILWTERGAARHAKMLETDQAWEVFEKLEDCYFSQKTNVSKPTPPKAKVESVNAAELLFKLNLICTTWDAARSEIAKFDPKMASHLDSTMSMFWMYTMSMKGIAGRNVSLRLSS